MKLLIVNQPLYNKGDSAAHKSFLRTLKQLLPNASIEVVLVNANNDAVNEFSVAGVKYSITSYMDASRLITYLQRLFYRIFLLLKIQKLALLFPYLNEMSKKIQNADMVICAPGGICMGGFRNWNHISILWIAKYFHKPVFYYSRSIGPFSDKGWSNKLFKKNSISLLKYFSFISLRDSKSAKFADALGIEYMQTVDPVFLNTPAKSVYPAANFKLSNSYVVFVPNRLTWQYTYQNVPQERIDSFYLQIMKLLAKRFVDMDILMLPQLFGVNRGDHAYFEQLKEKSKMENVIVMPENISSDVQQLLISNSSLVIGARYHSIVFAINNCVPFVSLSYEHKMNGLLESLDKQNSSFDLTKISTTKWSENESIAEIERMIATAKPDLDAREKAHIIAQNCMEKMVEQIKKEERGAEI